VTKIGELGTTQAATSNRRTLRRNTSSVLTRATRRNNPEDTILHSHSRENLKSYISLFNSQPNVSSPVFSQQFLETDISLPLGFETEPVPRQLKFQANSYNTIIFLVRPTLPPVTSLH
jgi:hypothetical protein